MQRLSIWGVSILTTNLKVTAKRTSKKMEIECFRYPHRDLLLGRMVGTPRPVGSRPPLPTHSNLHWPSLYVFFGFLYARRAPLYGIRQICVLSLSVTWSPTAHKHESSKACWV